MKNKTSCNTCLALGTFGAEEVCSAYSGLQRSLGPRHHPNSRSIPNKSYVNINIPKEKWLKLLAHESCFAQLFLAISQCFILACGHPQNMILDDPEIWDQENSPTLMIRYKNCILSGYDCYIAMVKPWPIEIDGLPFLKMVMFHGELWNNQIVRIV